MDNSTIQPHPAEGSFDNTESYEEQTRDGQTEMLTAQQAPDGINGTELFSFFTADIIRKKVLFTR